MDEYIELIEELLEGTGWEIYDPEMAPDVLLTCPCGLTVEVDGRCPSGHVSPLRGVIV